MSTNLIIASGFLFLGGLTMYLFHNWSDPRRTIGILLALMGSAPLITIWFKWFKELGIRFFYLITGYSPDNEIKKEENSHEDA